MSIDNELSWSKAGNASRLGFREYNRYYKCCPAENKVWNDMLVIITVYPRV